jgi:hypothetical protein
MPKKNDEQLGISIADPDQQFEFQKMIFIYSMLLKLRVNIHDYLTN